MSGSIYNRLFARIGFLPERQESAGKIVKFSRTTKVFVGKWKKKKVFLKVGETEGKYPWFSRNRKFCEIAQKGEFKIGGHIPKLYFWGDKEKYGAYFLMFERVDGESLGISEPVRQVKGLEEGDLGQILNILFSLQEVSVGEREVFEGKIESFSNSWYSRKLVGSLSQIEKRKLAKWARSFQDNKKALDAKAKYLIHKDFRPQNLLKTSEGKIYLVDFDFLGVGSRVFDFLTFWAFLYKRPDLRKAWWEGFRGRVKLTEDERAILKFEKLYFLLLETNELFRKQDRGLPDPQGEIIKWKEKTFEEFKRELNEF